MEAILEAFAIAADPPPDLRPRYNLGPSQTAPVVRHDRRGRRELAVLRWGLVPGWADDPSIGQRLINARAESVADKPAFRDAFRHRRCVVPADGFFEWQARGDAKRGGKQPWLVRPAAGGLFALAGLWSHWRGPQGGDLETFTILTCQANQRLAPIHHRMPVILEPDGVAPWLDGGDDPAGLLSPAADDRVVAIAISTRVNALANDDPSVLQPAVPRPEEQFRLL